MSKNAKNQFLMFRFVASLILAIEIPNIGVVIDLLGCLAAVFIFIFPGICLWQTTLTKDPALGSLKSKALLLFAGFFLTIGAFLFGVVLTQVDIKLPLLLLFQYFCSRELSQTLVVTIRRRHCVSPQDRR